MNNDTAHETAAHETPLAVVIADDDPIVRQTLSAIIEKMAGIRVVASVENGRDALAAVERHEPSVVLMDLSMPVMDGFQATQEIKRHHPDTHVLALTALNDSARGHEAIAAGADSYLNKAVRRDLLEAAIRATAQGQGIVSSDVAASRGPAAKPSRRVPTLSAAELEVLRLLAQGKNNDEIAGSVYSSLASVKKRIASLQVKFGVEGRVSLAVRATQLGLFDVE